MLRGGPRTAITQSQPCPIEEDECLQKRRAVRMGWASGPGQEGLRAKGRARGRGGRQERREVTEEK